MVSDRCTGACIVWSLVGPAAVHKMVSNVLRLFELNTNTILSFFLRYEEVQITPPTASRVSSSSLVSSSSMSSSAYHHFAATADRAQTSGILLHEGAENSASSEQEEEEEGTEPVTAVADMAKTSEAPCTGLTALARCQLDPLLSPGDSEIVPTTRPLGTNVWVRLFYCRRSVLYGSIGIHWIWIHQFFWSNLDPDPEFWPDLDPFPGLCY